MSNNELHGGSLVASVLVKHGVQFLFTLCGGHISPILIAAKQQGIRVIDVRDEATTVFAADAVSRLSGVPGIAAVTAGPGLTNTITAVKNAQLAQSPVIIFGGATATLLKGRGSLQDIDQMALMKPHVKWTRAIRRVREIVPALQEAFTVAQSGTPGPVFVEFPVDLLYPESLIRSWYGKSGSGKGWRGKMLQRYLSYHANRLFKGVDWQPQLQQLSIACNTATPGQMQQVVARLKAAQKPVMLIGSQAMLEPKKIDDLQKAVESLQIPVYLSGMARGLLGKNSPLQLRHKRRQALKESDLVLLAGVPCDFRLDYGRHIPSRACYISVNRNSHDLKKNRRPNIAILGDPGDFLRRLSQSSSANENWSQWLQSLRQRDEQREQEINAQAQQSTDHVNPLHLCQQIEREMAEDSIIVADGGDFVATASYILRPQPLSWLDPGPFGTLGVGAGFALGAKLCRPQSQVWIVYGDGSVGYSLCEWDTFVRHKIPVIAVVGNDACWSQIAREQIDVFKDDTGTVLAHSDYHKVAEGFAGGGLLLKAPEQIADVLQEAQQMAKEGKAVLVNALIGKTDFRKGSISI